MQSEQKLQKVRDESNREMLQMDQKVE
jgi:rubrerythrin